MSLTFNVQVFHIYPMIVCYTQLNVGHLSYFIYRIMLPYNLKDMSCTCYGITWSTIFIYFERCEQNKCKCLFTYIHLDLFRFHPSNYIIAFDVLYPIKWVPESHYLSCLSLNFQRKAGYNFQQCLCSLARLYTVGWPTSSSHLYIPKIEEGWLKKWKVDYSIKELNSVG